MVSAPVHMHARAGKGKRKYRPLVFQNNLNSDVGMKY